MKEKLFVLGLISLYIGSLFLPGLVFEPTLRDNPKYSLCVCPMTEGYVMDRETRGCGLKDRAGIKNPMSEDEVYAICGDDWNTPVVTDMKGYTILFFGWAGILELNFAWFANIFFLYALFAFMAKQYKNSFNLSLAAIPFALSAFSFSRIPHFETNLYDEIVDHLGAGYYLWLFVILVLAVYTYVLAKKSINEKVTLTPLKVALVIGGLALLTVPGAYAERQRIEIEKQREQSQKISQEKPTMEESVFTERYAARVDRVDVVFEHKDYTRYRLTTNGLVREGELNTERGFEDDIDATVYVLDWQKPEQEQMVYVRLTAEPNRLYALDSERKILRGSALALQP